MRCTCEQCGEQFEAKTETAKLCGPRCRKRASRAANNADSPAKTLSLADVIALGAQESPLVAATRRDLEEAGLEDTVMGQLALELAEKVGSSRDTGSAKAAASKEFRSVLAEAFKDVPKQADGIDELMMRRMQRASGG